MATLSSFVFRAEPLFASRDSWGALTALTPQVGYVAREARGACEYASAKRYLDPLADFLVLCRLFYLRECS